MGQGQKSRIKPSSHIKNMKLTLELLSEDLGKTKMCLDHMKHLISTPLDLEVRKNSLRFIEKLCTLVQRTEDNYQHLESRIDSFSEAISELEKAVNESYKNINERFDFWLHDLGNNKQENLNFLEFFESIRSNETAYTYFLNRLVNDKNTILIGKSALVGNRKISDQSLAYSEYVEPPKKWLNPLKKIHYKLFKKPNKCVYHLFSPPRKDRNNGFYKGKGNLELKEYRPFKHDDSDQLLKILYDFINMHGIDY